MADKINLPKEWEKYQWVVDLFCKNIPEVIFRSFDHGNACAVVIGDGLDGGKKKRTAIRLKHGYRGEKAEGHSEYVDGEEYFVWDKNDWQTYDILNNFSRKKLTEVVLGIKSRMNE